MIKIENIYKSFDHKNVLTNISLEIPKGSIYGIIGYSGAGKSTLIRIINALEIPDSGKVFINNTELYSLDKKKIQNEKVVLFKTPIMTSLLSHFTPRNAPFRSYRENGAFTSS